jgi:hypothetical protein
VAAMATWGLAHIRGTDMRLQPRFQA